MVAYIVSISQMSKGWSLALYKLGNGRAETGLYKTRANVLNLGPEWLSVSVHCTYQDISFYHLLILWGETHEALLRAYSQVQEPKSTHCEPGGWIPPPPHTLGADSS